MRKLSKRVLVVALLVTTAVVVSGCGSDTGTGGSGSSSSTTSTTVPATRPDTAIWPFDGSDTRFDEPRKAAEGFVVEYLGFVAPVVGAFAPGDTGSGTVGVQPNATGPVTTVSLRQASDDSWWVEGATTPNLGLEAPVAGASITSPVPLSGRSTAFEGTVAVQIREEGTLTPIGSDFVTGGANGEMGPFSKAIAFTPPDATTGAIVLTTASGEDGTIREATVTAVRFG